MFLPGLPGSSFSAELTECVMSLISVSSLAFNSIASLPKRKRLLTMCVTPTLTALNLIQVFSTDELSGWLGFSSLDQKVALSFVSYQEVAHPQYYLRRCTLVEMLNWSALCWCLVARWKRKYPRELFSFFF